jgi:hypothetical protein
MAQFRMQTLQIDLGMAMDQERRMPNDPDEVDLFA